MEQKINNTFLKAHEQIDSLQKAFRQGGKLEKAITESGGDTSVIAAVNRALTEASNSIVSAVTPQVLSEGVLDDQDDDGFMARSQLYFLAKNAIALHGMIDDRDDLEPWVHTKIVAASEGIDAVRRYTEYNAMKNQMQPEMEPQPTADTDMNEGTWSLPSDMTAVGELIELFQDPIPAKDAPDALYSLIGDDELFDSLGELEDDNPETDARPTIARWIENNNALLINNIEDFNAIKSLNKLTAQFVESEMEESYSQGDENEQGMVSNCCGAPIMDVYQGHGRCSDCKEMASAELEENVDPDMLSDLFDNLKRGDKVKIKHDSALEKGTDYIEYIVKANNVLRNGVGKATLARADSPTSVKRFLYKRNGKVSMAIGDMAATLVDIQVSEEASVTEAEKRWKQTSLSPAEAEKMYGAANVRVKKGALRNGDDMVEILSEAELDEGMNFDDKKDSELKVVAKDMFKSALAQARKKSGVK